jgi:ABC-2 type transport system ATP-binding protein
MAAIETTALTKRYGSDVYAVTDLDLAVAEGEIFGFLGPNGAGKSTTINMLLDFVRPTAGTASVLGMDAQTETRAIHERIGVLPDAYGLYDRLDGYTHLRFAADLKGVDDDPDALLETVGLDRAAAERAVGGYSKGMTQRLALAIALVGDPDLLILDEPTSGVDPNGAREIRELVRSRAQQGTTVFFSSHVLEQVEAVCDRVGIMNDGRLVAVDTIDGLRRALGEGSTVRVSVDRVPDTLDLTDVPGVSRVVLDGTTVRATCTDPGAKVDVLDRVRDAGASVVDFTTHEPSLEELFAAYTAEVEA